MMELTIGKTVIPYELRESPTATRKRIVVTPGRVEVVVPVGTPLEGAQGVLPYLHGKRRWVFDSVHEVEAKHRALLAQQYASGAKLQYRGRWLMLDVQLGAVAAVTIAFRSKFHVLVPADLAENERIEAIRVAFDCWLRDRALDDVERFGHQHETTLGMKAAGYRLSDARGRWGSCGKERLIFIHWRLIQAPSAALEYVVAHEVAHLAHRNHSTEFWAFLGKTLPDWADRKAMLEKWEAEHRAL